MRRNGNTLRPMEAMIELHAGSLFYVLDPHGTHYEVLTTMSVCP